MPKPTHFTYEDIGNASDDLHQGDIIQPSPALRAILADVHPHFTNDKYMAFLVLTHTCDLVRREGQPCNSRYVNLATVRPLETVLRALLEKACDPVRIGHSLIEGVYVEESRLRAEQLLHRVFNQNEQALGAFYLHHDAAVGIADPSVALLQVSIAIRAHEHYQMLVGARTGRLRPEFRDKLGWLAGNLFARVATQDMHKAERDKLVDRFLQHGGLRDDGPHWIPRASVKKVKQMQPNARHLGREKIIAFLREHAPEPGIDIAIDRVASVVGEVVEGVSPQQLDQVRNRLANDPRFEAVCR